MESGVAHMTTPIGLIPINSDGMRQIADILDATQTKLTYLTAIFLQLGVPIYDSSNQLRNQPSIIYDLAEALR